MRFDEEVVRSYSQSLSRGSLCNFYPHTQAQLFPRYSQQPRCTETPALTQFHYLNQGGGSIGGVGNNTGGGKGGREREKLVSFLSSVSYSSTLLPGAHVTLLSLWRGGVWARGYTFCSYPLTMELCRVTCTFFSSTSSILLWLRITVSFTNTSLYWERVPDARKLLNYYYI